MSLITSIICQIKLLSVYLIAHYQISALLTPLPHGEKLILNKAIPRISHKTVGAGSRDIHE